MRHTMKELEHLAETISRVTGRKYFVGCAYGRPRFHCEMGPGCEDISPRLPTGELYRWMHAYLAGIHVGRSCPMLEEVTK